MKNLFLDAKEVSVLLSVSMSHAYKIIQILNGELNDKGYLTIHGKVPKAYFEEKIYGGLRG